MGSQNRLDGDAIAAAKEYLEAKRNAAQHQATLADKNLLYWQKRNVADALTLMGQAAADAERSASDQAHHARMDANAHHPRQREEQMKIVGAFVVGLLVAAFAAVILFR